MSATGPLIAATDLSAPARQAAERAARLAHETGHPLTLVHVVPQGPLAELREWLGVGAADQVRADALASLRALAASLRSSRHVEVSTQIESGPVAEALIAAADAHGAGLLVLGARGAGFLRRLTLGTTAERLLRRTQRPLLLVRQAPHEPYRRALLALDFSPWTPLVIAQARRIAPHARWVLFTAYQVPFGEKLRFAGVDPATVEHYRQQARVHATQRLHLAAEKAGLQPSQWEPCVIEGDAALTLVEQEQEQGCDLVVIGKHGHSAAEDLLLGSTTQHLLAEGQCDVLVVTGPGAAGAAAAGA